MDVIMEAFPCCVSFWRSSASASAERPDTVG